VVVFSTSTEYLATNYKYANHARNTDLYTDHKMEMVRAEIRRFARKHKDRLLHRDNVEAIQLLDNIELQRGLNP